MYTEEDRKMANDILGFVYRQSMIKDSDLYREMRKAYGRSDDSFGKKVGALSVQLETLGLLHHKNSEFTLTHEGMEAYTMQGGIDAYMSAKKRGKQIESELKVTTIALKKVQIIVGLTSILSFIAGFLLSGPIKNLLNYILSKA